MDFLRCIPSVFVIGNEYEISVSTKENGISYVQIGNTCYYEDFAGVLSSEKDHSKIRVPQSALDTEKKYSVVFRRTVNRKAYRSELDEPQTADFEFKPLTKTDGINIYHISDVHYHFEIAKKACAYFGDDLDLLIVNGDIGEVETVENYFEVSRFVGDISGGRIPVIFVRGNHDTRGKLAERFGDFFPTNGKNTYFTFEVGSLYGVALDCGEDKADSHPEYSGANVFELFRRRETDFLRAVPRKENKLTFAVSHICPSHTTKNKGNVFDIEKDVYTKWNKELDRIGTSFMITGHMHKTYLLGKDDERNTLPHNYPVIVGAECFGNDDIWGTAMTVNEKKLTVRFTDASCKIIKEAEIDLSTGDIFE